MPTSPTQPVIAIDPGSEQSACLVWSGGRIYYAVLRGNHDLLEQLRTYSATCDHDLHIEMIASYGMPVGREVFDTCVWIGRFIEAWKMATGKDAWLTVRSAIKLHHCHSARAKDSNIRQALIDKYGAPGTKREPGVTYGLKKDLWAAFALATYVTETRKAA